MSDSVTPWTSAHQAPLSSTVSRSWLKFMSIASVMLFKHLSLSCPILLLPSILLSIGSFPMSGLFTSDGQSIDAFELWCWRIFLRVPWTVRRSNESILKEINLEYSLEELTLKLPYFGHRCEEPTHWKRPRCWERLNAEGEGGDRR